MKKAITLLLCALLTVGLFTGCAGSAGGGEVMVQSITTVAEISGLGSYNRYGGVVVAQDEIEITKDPERTVSELFVEEGQEVKKGDVLFTYDVEEIEISLERLRLEREQIESSISSSYDQIKQLENERANASSDDKLSYTLEIQSIQISITESEYSLKSKDKEIERMESILTNIEVTSPVDGVVRKVSSDSSQDYYSEFESGAFIVITETGDYKVKGTINEMNNGDIMEGNPVIIRSRIDDTVSWTGVIEKIDWDNQQTGNNYYYTDPEASSSHYPFYIVLDSADGLFIGQHVYIEPDYGQGEMRKGMWLSASFICDRDGDAYVWAADSNDKIEKRSVTLGEYDSLMDMYEVTSGLTITDYIAFPDETVSEGMDAVKYGSDFGDDLSDDVIGDGAIVYEDKVAASDTMEVW